MAEADNDLRAILEHNVGFEDLDRWVEYARRHSFKTVRAVSVRRCPDCSGSRRGGLWGQYIYYSTLIHLLECADCGLIWADAHIEPGIIQGHFEIAYKDEEYFQRSREPIFEHLVSVIDRVSPPGARVLDIGGARGHLMAKLVARRPDVSVVVNDISKAATDWVAEHLKFPTLRGGADDLAAHQGQYDVVVLSDVIYYEPQLRVLWDALGRLVAPGGSIVVRIPNKQSLIGWGQRWYRLTHPGRRRAMQDRIYFFNPEHIYLVRQRYLRRRLGTMGFTEFQALPSPPLRGRTWGSVGALLFNVARGANLLSRHRLVLTPASVLVGRRPGA